MRKPLSDLATIHYGKSPSEVLDTDGPFPVMGTGGEYERASKSMFSSGVVVPRKGSLGNPQIVENPFWPSDTTYAVIPKPDIDIQWLYYNLLNYDLTKLNEATGVPSISRDWLSKVRFFDPGSIRQCFVAEILQTIDQTIEKTEVLIEKYQQIKAGLMHDLFTRGIGADGQLRPPREQAPELYQAPPIGWIPKEWSVTRLSTILASIDSGWSPSCPEVPPGIGEWGVLKVSAVTKGYYDSSEAKTLPDNLRPIPSLEVRDGDVILTRANGAAELVGKCVQVSSTQERLMLSDKLLRLTPKGDLMTKDFLALLMSSKTVTHQIEKTMSGSSGQKNISQADIRGFSCQLPSTNEQGLISDRLLAIDGLVNKEGRCLRKLKKKKQGLMNDLLTGKVQVKVDQSEATYV